MSLVTYPTSIKPNASGHAPKKSGPQAGRVLTTSSRLRKIFAAAGRLCVNIFDAITEARVQKAMIEADLYLNRYKHTPKNDDDLPVLR